MKLEDLVPPLELCKKIPDGIHGNFHDCAFCWHYTDTVGFICRTSGCEQVQSKQWQIVNNHRRKIEIRRKHGEEIYPAPTLQEVLEELHKQQEDVFLKWSETAYNEWLVNAYTHNKEDYQAHDNNQATAALKVWLKHKLKGN